jgi:hypothetical protein
MAESGYLPSEAVLRGLGVKDREFVDVWTEVHRDNRSDREIVTETLLTLATEVTGEEQRRASSAMFALTQAVFDRGDVALPDAYATRTLDALRLALSLGFAENSKAQSALEAAIRRLEFRALAHDLGISPR